MLLLGAGLAAGAAVVVWFSRRYRSAGRFLDGIAAAAAFLFFVLSAAAVRDTIVHGTVFMTEVHRIFLHPVFLASGAYLGPYVLGQMVLRVFSSIESESHSR
ncbi:hypothetical protein KP806_09855 [Paenibacillus sp. N4]|uniref:hypothetical protein n=1 Tax=Paenibacillus vietnamensis TaxID=2590547 RepID=UPI001CD1181A|nr:hypothetical protein [Paenibacillus vietnamensis]MCA0755355.1 hypothetical protein [Paenibacillus vietnamensis]